MSQQQIKRAQYCLGELKRLAEAHRCRSSEVIHFYGEIGGICQRATSPNTKFALQELAKEAVAIFNGLNNVPPKPPVEGQPQPDQLNDGLKPDNIKADAEQESESSENQETKKPVEAPPENAE